MDNKNMKQISGTLIWYYYVCQREVWLMAHSLEPSQDNTFIEIGRLISEESYKREKKEIHLDNIVIDVIKKDEDELIVGEVKKSSKFKKSATMQLAFYLKKLKENGIKAKGELLFPKEKKKIEVFLTPEIELELNETETKINDIMNLEIPPLPKKINFCKNCGYEEFCWA